MATREQKLQFLAKRHSGNDVVVNDIVLQTLQDKIDSLKQLLGCDISINADSLVDALSKVESLNLAVNDLKSSIGTINLKELNFDTIWKVQTEPLQIEGQKDLVKTAERLQRSISNMPTTVQLEGLPTLLVTLKEYAQTIQQLTSTIKQPNIKVDFIGDDKIIDITNKLELLTKAVEQTKVNQNAADYIPTRRVRRIGSSLVFDDDIYTGGSTGGGGTASVQNELISGNAVKVVSQDGASLLYTTGTPTETTIAVTNSSTSVLAANPNRTYLELVNDSDTIIYICKDGGAAAVNSGTRLNANGGSVVYDKYIPTNTITAIHGSSSNKNLLVTEG